MRRKRTTQNSKDYSSLSLEVVVSGAYFWYRAETPEENIISSLHRGRYHQIRTIFKDAGIPLPSPKELYDYAAAKWPPHKLHEPPPTE